MKGSEGWKAEVDQPLDVVDRYLPRLLDPDPTGLPPEDDLERTKQVKV